MHATKGIQISFLDYTILASLIIQYFVTSLFHFCCFFNYSIINFFMFNILVALQFPEGFLVFACDIADILEEYVYLSIASQIFVKLWDSIFAFFQIHQCPSGDLR